MHRLDTDVVRHLPWYLETQRKTHIAAPTLRLTFTSVLRRYRMVRITHCIQRYASPMAYSGTHHPWHTLVLITHGVNWYSSIMAYTGTHHTWRSLVRINHGVHFYAAPMAYTGTHHPYRIQGAAVCTNYSTRYTYIDANVRTTQPCTVQSC